jgi:hypothetical protein
LPSSGHLLTSVLEMVNSALLICILQSYFKLLFLQALRTIYLQGC